MFTLRESQTEHIEPTIVSTPSAQNQFVSLTYVSSPPKWPPYALQSQAEPPKWTITGQQTTTLITHLNVVQAFVAVARRLPHVQQILVDDPVQVRRIWTIITAPPFEDSYRMEVYEAQLAALGAAGYPPTDFRLINTQEFTTDINAVLPPRYQVVFRR